MSYILEVKDLKVSFKDKKVLRNINVKFKRNKITAIIGPSGCGKSTFLKTLNCLILEDSEASVYGDIIFNSESLLSMEREIVRQKIGMVFQNPTPFPLSIYKNMEYALRFYGVSRKKRHEIINEKLKLTGLYDEIKDSLNKSALKLSGGQQQRLCIARALTVEPEILLLDEPCSALDVKNTLNIEKLLTDIKQKYTIIIVTHNLPQARRIADETLFMLDGEVVEFDDTEKIFKNPSDQRTKEYIFGLFG
ncbi:phosphate ABC transporter ATP-binding protein [Caminicella sporogenes]|uniref:phosphate ABC transporter ATP-binding protein n=1 Tax=Caminicella sporogenes TaxID=166485 RepID=UPI002542409C|nr:phosphate ABC transporter ATP-binding protein [Caminicella sporogenes]WIF96171.1 phosphate ABC transporter ATP-binding protein [Caminicella sporogenes]